MDAIDLKAIQDILAPQFAALGGKMDEAVARFEKSTDGNRESIRQLYEENKEIRANMATADTELRKEITASASSLRAESAEQNTRIVSLEQSRDNKKTGKSNWIALAGVILMGLIFVVDKFLSALGGKTV